LPPTRPRRHTRRDPPSSALSTSCSLCFIRALARTSQCDPVGGLTVRRREILSWGRVAPLRY
jgi:hypothetical protein